MIVTFVSQCQKNSLKITRQILDSYANRIGERTWQTVITQEGLNAVKTRLAKSARKTTAVACHRMHGTSRTELMWIVGNKREFDAFGNVPVHRTSRDLMKTQDENDWEHLALIKVLVALSALFHDFGKSWDHFQIMLKDNKKKDPIRHEWISLLLFKALVQGKTDEQWLGELAQLNQADIKTRKAFVNQLINSPSPLDKASKKPFKGMTTFSRWIAWLIVSHHRLPKVHKNNFDSGDVATADEVFACIILDEADYLKSSVPLKALTWTFSNSLPALSEKWCQVAAHWGQVAKNILANKLVDSLQSNERLILILARLSLMLGDHNYSNKAAQSGWDELKLYANTDKKNEKGERPLKQKLDEHLVRVKDAALDVAKLLPVIEDGLERATHIRALRKPSPSAFHWQNKVVSEIAQWKQTYDIRQNGFFAINMASTGTGKTFANAKIMYALSADESLRCNFALGLRTLTLQTGDEYREKIFQNRSDDSTELAVLIGSAAVQYLHEQKQRTLPTESKAIGSESSAELDELFEVSGGTISAESVLETLFSFKGEKAQHLNAKKRRFLDSPIVVSTIDHLMPATESVRGGHHILPILRLMSADMVIDEIDDFASADYPALSRLVHLVGMLGRKLMISSATIPPAIAIGLFQAYQTGWTIFANSRGRKSAVSVLWVDEFRAETALIPERQVFTQQHQQFVQKRLKSLGEQAVKRKAKLLPITPVTVGTEITEAYPIYFQSLLQAAVELHHAHALKDEQTGKFFSLGVIRLANIEPCIALSQYLLSVELPVDVEIRLLCYHARQVLLLRSAQEFYLDQVLKRNKNNPTKDLIIRQHLANSQKAHVLFMVISSPIEETGRDHDFDWAVIEPSSMRSIIQMAGRVLRHRTKKVDRPNVVIPEYNLKGFLSSSTIVFTRPGYESSDYRLISHSLRDVLDMPRLEKCVDASPRIQANEKLQVNQRLDDLEHEVLNKILLDLNYRPNTVQGWLAGSYYLSQLAQNESRFRQNERLESTYKLHLGENDEWIFRVEDKEGKGRAQDHIHLHSLSTQEQQRLWLELDYAQLIDEQMEKSGKTKTAMCEFLGTFSLPDLDSAAGLVEFTFTPECGFSKK